MGDKMEIINNLSYNSIVIISFFIISFIAFILKVITKNKTNDLLFSSYKSSMINPLTYVRLFTHIFGHANWNHFMNNFLYILLIGPMIEEKYGSKNLVIMILITAFTTGLLNMIFSNKKILGASGIVFMFIVLSSFVNIESGKIPITLILICVFYLINEVLSIFKKDNISHVGHLIGAVCGFIFGYYIF